MSTPRLSETGEKIVDKPSRLGKFIQTYHSFLSTFVIGAAGLVATSIWQYRQSEIARRQAESQAQIAAVAGRQQLAHRARRDPVEEPERAGVDRAGARSSSATACCCR